jgi:arsenate reductase
MPKRILFLCTGNAVRSQMAEALANAFHGERFSAVSAGSRPAGFVHPLAIRALGAIGIDATRARSKIAAEFDGEAFDLVVTVCDSAAADCPHWPNAKRIEHWPIEDPSAGAFDDASHLRRFVETRDELERRIAALSASLS